MLIYTFVLYKFIVYLKIINKNKSSSSNSFFWSNGWICNLFLPESYAPTNNAFSLSFYVLFIDNQFSRDSIIRTGKNK